MQLSSFELVKKGVSTIIDVVDTGAREQINELNSSLNGKQNVVDNALMTTAKTIVGAINEINSDLTETNSDLAEFTAANNYRIKSNTEHVDVLNISITDVNSIANKPHLVQQISGSPLSGMPSDVGSIGFVGVRYVHYFDSNNILVELKSMSPPFITYYTRYSDEQHAWTSWYRSIPTVVS